MSKVLLAYDGSDGAKKALAAAAELGGELSVISVAPLMVSGRGGAIDPSSDVAEHRASLDEAGALLAEKGIEAHMIEGVGQTADAIVTAAEKGGFDIIVIGSRGMGGVERFLIGSTSTRVVAHAPCSVLVTR